MRKIILFNMFGLLLIGLSTGCDSRYMPKNRPGTHLMIKKQYEYKGQQNLLIDADIDDLEGMLTISTLDDRCNKLILGKSKIENGKTSYALPMKKLVLVDVAFVDYYNNISNEAIILPQKGIMHKIVARYDKDSYDVVLYGYNTHQKKEIELPMYSKKACWEFQELLKKERK